MGSGLRKGLGRNTFFWERGTNSSFRWDDFVECGMTFLVQRCGRGGDDGGLGASTRLPGPASALQVYLIAISEYPAAIQPVHIAGICV